MSPARTSAPPPRKRYRARVEGGGYYRKTLSLPAELVRRIDAHLRTRPGLTMSAFISDEIERVLQERA
jgi:hypothetical protein